MRVNIPLSDYTDGVRRLIMTANDGRYSSVLATAEFSDLETALQILTVEDKLPSKRSRIRHEIYIRTADTEKNRLRLGTWRLGFANRWKEMQALFGKA